MRAWLTAAVLVSLAATGGRGAEADATAFWSRPQRGANSFNAEPPGETDLRALREYGATWVRLAFSKWPSGARDFLLGDADRYERLEPADLATLEAALDRAHHAGLKVVVTPLSLPGARWRQQNGGTFDDRLWSDRRFWGRAAAFWRDLARALHDHPAIVGYNLLNEPAPERRGGLDEEADPAAMRAWYAEHRDSPRDLPALYDLLVREIRAVDTRMPIMVDAGFHAAPFGYQYWPAPLADGNVLYAFHMYEPWLATSAGNLKRETPYTYPGIVRFHGRDERWDARRVETFLQLPLEWASRHEVPSSRLVAAEFGCMRRWPSCREYLEDVVSTLEANRLHWAFYAFREDGWDGMDYELGSGPMPAGYWQARAAGRHFTVRRGPTPLFEPILRRLRSDAR
jgi:hypothetical protein